MNIVQKEIRLSSLGYYVMHLSLVNCFLDNNLTNKEIEILGAFMMLDVEDEERFNSSSRKLVFNQLGKALKTNINFYLSSMLKKGVLVKKNGNFYISSILFPNNSNQGYQFKIVRDGK